MTTNTESECNDLSWQDFRNQQQEMVLQAGTAAHIPVTIRYIDKQNDGGSFATPRKTILLMHGIPTWGYLYHAIIPKLVQEGYRVLAPDFLGHGWSDRRDRFDRSFQDQARMIKHFLKALNISHPIDIVGHDTGGAVALILAIEHSELVHRMVITNSVCYDSFDDDMLDFGRPLQWKPKPISDLVNALEESLEMGISRKHRLTKTFREGIIAPWSSEEGKLSLLRNASALNANQTMALVDRHGTIQAETLVLWGMDDPWQKSDDGMRLASEIPKATFVPIHNACHWIQQDAPEEFTTEIVKFFS